MAVDLGLEESQHGDYRVISVDGEIDVYTAPHLRDRLVDVVAAGATKLCVDLNAVQFLDSTGLGVLVGALKRVNAQSGEMVIVCERAHILKVFEITGLSKVFRILPSLDDLPG